MKEVTVIDESWKSCCKWFWSLSYKNNVILYVDFHCSADVCHVMVQGKTWKCDSASLLVKNIECILKIFITIKATEDCWLLFSLLLTFFCVNLPYRRILNNRVGSPVLLRDHQVSCKCLSAMSMWFSDNKVWPILGKKEGVVICHRPWRLTTKHIFILLMTYSIL